MGKAKKRSSRVHVAAAKVCSSGERNKDEISNASIPPLPVIPIPTSFMTKEPFIPFKEHHEVVSTEVSNPRSNQHDFRQVDKKTSVTKRDKRKNRHQAWLTKLENCKQVEQEKKATQKRKNTVIVGDLRPLLSSLPSLPSTNESTNDVIKKEKNENSMPKTVQHRNVYKEIDHFKQVLDHPVFLSNPLETVSDHIRNSITLNNM